MLLILIRGGIGLDLFFTKNNRNNLIELFKT